MKKNVFWVTIGITTLLICWLFYPHRIDHRETYLIISSYLGRVVGILLFPTIIALIFKGVAKIFNKDFGSSSYRTTFFSIWIILALSSLIAFLYNPSTKSDQQLTNHPNQTEQIQKVLYHPPKNEYSVFFTNKPKLKKNTFLINNLESETAELVLVEEGGFVRAESFLFTDQLNKATINQKYVIDVLKKYSKYNGLQFPEFSYKKTNLGKVGKIRGFKSLKDNTGQEIKVTFGFRAYFGNTSGMILEGASPSTIYPTPKIVSFFNSIKKQ